MEENKGRRGGGRCVSEKRDKKKRGVEHLMVYIFISVLAFVDKQNAGLFVPQVDVLGGLPASF